MLAPVIAVLDPDPVFLLFMNEFLTDEGYETSLWSDGHSATAMVQRTLPDLIILDLWLDVRESGWAVLVALESDSATCAIPIIVCFSGGELSETQVGVLRERHCIVLEKPFELDEMLTLIDTALDNSTGYLPRTADGHFDFPLTLDG